MSRYATSLITLIIIILGYFYVYFYWANGYCWVSSYSQNGTFFWIITPDIYTYSDKDGLVLELDNSNYVTDVLFFNDSILVLNQIRPHQNNSIIYYNKNNKKTTYSTFEYNEAIEYGYLEGISYMHNEILYTTILGKTTNLTIDNTNGVFLSDTLLSISSEYSKKSKYAISSYAMISNELSVFYPEHKNLVINVRNDTSFIQLPNKSNDSIVLHQEPCICNDID